MGSVQWVRLSSVADPPGLPMMCCRCSEFDEFENMWTAIPFSEQGKRMMQGYIHCGTCKSQTNPLVAWKQAHAREFAP